MHFNKIPRWFIRVLTFENHGFPWSVTSSFGLYLCICITAKASALIFLSPLLSHFINITVSLPSAFLRHNLDGTGSAFPVSQSFPVALRVKSWLVQPVLVYSLPTILDALLIISMGYKSNLGRNRVATLNWKSEKSSGGGDGWGETWMTRAHYANSMTPCFFHNPFPAPWGTWSPWSAPCLNFVFILPGSIEMSFLPGRSFLNSPGSHLG